MRKMTDEDLAKIFPNKKSDIDFNELKKFFDEIDLSEKKREVVIEMVQNTARKINSFNKSNKNHLEELIK